MENKLKVFIEKANKVHEYEDKKLLLNEIVNEKR